MQTSGCMPTPLAESALGARSLVRIICPSPTHPKVLTMLCMVQLMHGTVNFLRETSGSCSHNEHSAPHLNLTGAFFLPLSKAHTTQTRQLNIVIGMKDNESH